MKTVVRIFVLALLVLQTYYLSAQTLNAQSEITYEKDTLDELVKVSEERAKGIAKGFFNLNYYLESREAKRVLENPAIQEVIRLYEDSTNIKVISTSYINLPANDFWTKGARNSALKNFEILKSSKSTFLANEVKFGPGDTSYGVNVDLYPDSELESTSGLTKDHIDEIALPIVTELFYPKSYESPGEAVVELKNYYTRVLGEIKDFKAEAQALSQTELDTLLVKVNKGIDAGESWNPDSYACNNAVRAFLYYLKGDAVLFPVTDPGKPATHKYGSGLTGPSDPVTVLKGKVRWSGVANKMYESLEAGDLNDKFEQLTKKSTETYDAFFADLQKRANRGEIIIGVVKETGHGHIVALLPRTLYSFPTNKMVLFDDESNVTFPIALEAGGDDKLIKPFIGTKVQITRSMNPYIWFKYK